MQTFYANDTITPLQITPCNDSEAQQGKVINVPEKYSWLAMLAVSIFVSCIAFFFFESDQICLIFCNHRYYWKKGLN